MEINKVRTKRLYHHLNLLNFIEKQQQNLTEVCTGSLIDRCAQ